MTTPRDSRETEQALRWTEAATGGRIIRKQRQMRWRPMWLLDIEQSDGTVLPLILRGFRDPAGGSEQESRERLRLEAGFCKALQGTGVKLPRYYGYHAEGGWFLMQRLPGDHQLTRLIDNELQADLFRQYIENVALMHSLDYRALDLPDNMPIAQSFEEGCRNLLNWSRPPYDALPDRPPDPLIELCDWWLGQHRPAPVERYSVTTGDIGADQFMFENGRFTGMFDLEYCHVGDPLQDIGLMRVRNMTYPVPGFAEHVHHWAKRLGREIDKTSLNYWTLAVMTAFPMATYPGWVKPDPKLPPETVAMHAYIIVSRRGAAEALAEFYGVELTPPERPEPSANTLTKYHRWLSGQLHDHHVALAGADTRFALSSSAALAETAELCNTLGPELEHRNIADLAALLGFQPNSETAGLMALQHRIKTDPEKDLPQTIRALHNIESRNEFLLAPLQAFSGYATGVPLERMNWM